ncbi:hypothetical protein SAMN05216370_0887 [Pseudomonas peli]|uniref:Uncharacterized protein n=1 Tax=Pseudomonas peli TaxID=592361 RepID=A0AB37Z439_9PSED|nr:hypothetical protein [Pseudomonas peli]NMZ68848.1 hypothetical protein [Pseudomonas peli]SCW39015.1 hypothetical protein SAMN05216370_0887 [Pseudomonas peli]
MSTNQLTIVFHQFLQALLNEIKECRLAPYDFAVENRCYHALGQLAAALNLEAIDGQQYDRLSALLLNAAALRSEELLTKQPLHSRPALYAYLQARADKKQVAA